MRWGIFSDIHANLPALEAVLAEVDAAAPDRLLCLGDLVGYGPHPGEVVDRVRALECPVLAGNHDLAVIDRIDTSCFNPYARDAVKWTIEMLTEDHREYLDSLPMTWEGGEIAAVHGTHDEPEEFLYLQSLDHAERLLVSQPRFLGVYGHTHVPVGFLLAGGQVALTYDARMDLRSAERALVNVGSVGQPRDEDARAAWVLYDDETRRLEVRRVAYDFESVVTQIKDAGLPPILGERLRHGL